MLNSFITWVDHDQNARNKTIQLLANYGDHDSRDELGIGAIRDSISDFLFPGTSTIQTRLRYMLVVPWIYVYLENKRFRSDRFAQKAEQIERSLIRPLIAAADSQGAFGRTAKDKVKRLPSSVYWNGLHVWSIRKINLSQSQYQNQIGQIYHDQSISTKRVWESARLGDSSDDQIFDKIVTWDPGLPKPPNNFPDSLENLGFELTREEAEYLQQQMSLQNHTHNHHHSGNCLLGELVNKPINLKVVMPWDLIGNSDISEFNIELLTHAKLFSNLIHGAALLYNLMVAELVEADAIAENRVSDKRVGLAKTYRERLSIWSIAIPHQSFQKWSLEGFWEIISHPQHDMDGSTKIFVARWLDLCLKHKSDISNSVEARDLISDRERRKRAKSRIHKLDARNRWGGESGVNQLTYRWSNVIIILKDLYRGLGYAI